MTRKQLLKRIEELEARIVALEARPLYPLYQPTWQWFPPVNAYPTTTITSGSSS